MEYDRLGRLGRGFDDVNPYGWPGFRTIIRPVAVGVRWLLVWMHEHLHLAYGLVLVCFGIMVRILLWPLNQKAMRANMQLQAVQPLMKDIQERHKDDPQKMQQEMFKLYKEYNVNPLGGCWPMLLPMPVLFALFFVFQNTIELRGASFLWLPDLSRPDPLYIIPVIMGALDVGAQQGGPGRDGAESPDEDDAVHHAGHDDVPLPQLRLGAQPVLRGEQHREHPAAVDAGAGAAEKNAAPVRRRAKPAAAGAGEDQAEGLSARPAMLSDPIAALATPPGRSAIAVVRLSGDGALRGRGPGGRRLPRRPPARGHARHLSRSPRASRSTAGSYTVFPGPGSYTGEDLVELSCHGGLLAPARLLAALHAAGARPAAPGEFTRRAVLNGKLDLVQAEAVGDLIDAIAPAQARAALRQLDGGLSPPARRAARGAGRDRGPAGLRHRLSRGGRRAGAARADRGAARGGRGPDRAAARHGPGGRAAAGGRAARARRPAQRRASPRSSTRCSAPSGRW